MEAKTGKADAAESRPIGVAKRKTAAVRKKLQVAGAELHLSNAALEQHLPTDVKHGDVARALAQRESIEEKVVEAADELSVVHDLLHEEQAERARLEKELAEAVQNGANAK